MLLEYLIPCYFVFHHVFYYSSSLVILTVSVNMEADYKRMNHQISTHEYKRIRINRYT
jgi:hypothetical protein